MIVKERGEPVELYKLEALHRRIHPHHVMKEKVYIDVKRMKTGIKGEKEIDYSLQFLHDQDYLILQHVRLPDQNGTFQMDNLILTREYILILEVKNWYGTVFFDDNGQVIRIGDNGIEEGFPNPIPQAKLQKHRLQKWLHSQGISNIPIDYLVVISFPSTIMKSTSANQPIPNKVIHNNQLIFEIQNLGEVYQNSTMEMCQLWTLGQQLKAAHLPPNKNILKKYGIRKEELMRGVFCPNCFALPMIRKGEKWYCRSCQHTSKDAHFSALQDYQQLVGDYISNQEARDLFQIESSHVTKRLLQMGDYTAIGNTSSRRYKLTKR